MSIEDDIRYEPTIDDLYEAKLRICKERFHDLISLVTHGGQEILKCLRCDTEFAEVA